MAPPSTGPTRIAIGKAAPMMLMYFGRSRGVVTWATIVCDIRWRPAELMPCATRAMTSWVMSCAKPQARDATRNTASDVRNTRRGPTRSPTLPSTGSSTVLASV